MALDPLTQAQQILKAESEILLKKKLTNEEFLKLINNTERYLTRLKDIEDELNNIDEYYGDLKTKSNEIAQYQKGQIGLIEEANIKLKTSNDQHAFTDELLKKIKKNTTDTGKYQIVEKYKID